MTNPDYVATIASIKKSTLRNNTKLKQLLDYLFTAEHVDRRERPITWMDIARDLRGGDAKHKGSATRTQCRDLRRELRTYTNEAALGSWICELRDSVRGGGYHLEFRRKVPSPTEAFWRAHLDRDDNDIEVVYNELLFFHDEARNHVFRFWDMEDEVSRDKNRDALTRRDPTAYPKGYVDDLHVRRLYVLSSEIAARDALFDWFSVHAALKLRATVSRRADHFDKFSGTSLILLGSTRTNPLIRQIFEGEDCGHLGYRLHGTEFGRIALSDIRDDEFAEIKRHLNPACYSIEDKTVFLHNDLKDRNVFCVVTRLRNPYGEDLPLTMIASDYGRATEKVVKVLTEDALFREAVTATDVLSDSRVNPSCFQMLFTVKLPPADSLATPNRAELICCRVYDV